MNGLFDSPSCFTKPTLFRFRRIVHSDLPLNREFADGADKCRLILTAKVGRRCCAARPSGSSALPVMDFALLTGAVAAYKLRVSQPVQPAINAATRCCAVYGFPIRHSASPAMHNAAFAALGLNWRYLAFEVRPDDLRAAIAGAKAMQFSGLNLTVPHKLLAMQIVDELDESAKTWGAVNTVRFEAQDAGGQWQPLHHFSEPIAGEVRSQGFNTDSDGIARSLHEDLALKLEGAKVLLLGTGGAGQVAALRLALENVSELFLVDFVKRQGRDGGAGNSQAASAGESRGRLSTGAGGFVVECHAAWFEARRSVALGRKTVFPAPGTRGL